MAAFQHSIELDRRALRRFALLISIAFIPLVALTTFLVAPVLNALTVDRARDVGQILAAGAAAGSCGLVAFRYSGRIRLAWALIALAAISSFLGEAVEARYTLLLGTDAPFPSLADIGLLGAFPIAIAGLFAFPTAKQYATGLRALLDFAMFALSLTFILGALSAGGREQHFELQIVIGIGYTAFDVLLLTAVFITLRRSLAVHRGRIIVLLIGLAVIAISDSLTPALFALGGTLALGRLAEGGSIYGFAMVALAPWVPRQIHARQEDEDPLWHLMLPYAGLVAVAATAVYVELTNGQLSTWLVVPGAGLVIILVASQLVGYREANAMIRETREAIAKAQQRQLMLNQIIDHAPQGVAAISDDRRIINPNPRLAAIFYEPVEQLTGASLDDYMEAEYVTSVLASFGRPTGVEETYTSDCRAQRADGSEFWLHWSVTPIRKGDGSIDYFLGLFDDVTSRREAEETAVANLAQLEQLNHLKSEFVSIVSHEFRTGLVGIQGFSELIRDQEMDINEIRLLAEEINDDSQRLNRLITDMLDFDRLEAGKIRLDLKLIDLNQLADAALERARVATTKHHLTAHLQPNLPLVLADEDRLTQVLSNLLNNAIKYSPDGGEISVSTRTLSSGVELAVTDHGRGIPPEFIKRLFGRYERYEDKHAGKIIGTGLGLAIARQITEMHGGKITVESEVGKGSEFRVILPVAAGRPTVPIEIVDLKKMRPADGSVAAKPNPRV